MADNKSQKSGASISDAMNAFGMDDENIEKRAGILDKIILPTPEEPPVTVRLLWTKLDDGTPVAMSKVVNDMFKNKEGFFMTGEYYDRPGIRQLSLSNSLLGSIGAAAGIKKGITEQERETRFNDMIGKVGDISASYYKAAPKTKRSRICTKCNGTGCSHCTISGSGEGAGIATGMEPPVVYKFTLRDDLMNAVSNTKSASSQF
ncbi:MAG: hypothetical protein PHP08_00745 [Candidatus Dojkabacteria bacterium]|nr:hypothetical protein [Candidatus Dojkabacteria bacterium]